MENSASLQRGDPRNAETRRSGSRTQPPKRLGGCPNTTVSLAKISSVLWATSWRRHLRSRHNADRRAQRRFLPEFHLSTTSSLASADQRGVCDTQTSGLAAPLPVPLTTGFPHSRLPLSRIGAPLLPVFAMSNAKARGSHSNGPALTSEDRGAGRSA